MQNAGCWYRLTEKGTKVALLLILFHKELWHPLANSLFHHQHTVSLRPNGKLEAACHKAYNSIQTSSTCSKLPEFVEAFLFTNGAARICGGGLMTPARR